jgi:hypothetical protein
MICCVITRRVMTWEVKMDMHRMFLPASWWRTTSCEQFGCQFVFDFGAFLCALIP